MSKTKKIIILSTMFLLLGITGFLNVMLNNQVVNTGSGTISESNFFTTYRSDRQAVRDQELLYYDAIIASAESSADAKTNAEEMRASLIAAMDSELVTEGLLKAAGFEDVIVANTSGNVNIVVKSAELTGEEVAQIVTVVKEQINIDIDNIKIIPVA